MAERTPLGSIMGRIRNTGSRDMDIDSDTLGLQKKKLENERYQDNSEHRIKLAKWTKAVVSIWLTLVMLSLFINNCCLKLSDGVLIALLCTTTANVLGLAYIVLKGYFEVIGDNPST